MNARLAIAATTALALWTSVAVPPGTARADAVSDFYNGRSISLTIGYGLDLGGARDWGLFISSGRGKTSVGVEEPERFSEPGLFVVRPDATLYASSINTMPFARPNFGELVKSLEFIIAKDYPARGEVV